MKERIIQLLNTPKHQLSTAEEMYQFLGLTSDEEYDELGTALEELEKECIITHNKNNAFAMLAYFQMAKGVITIKEGGYGFLDTTDFSIHMKEGKTGTALNGDEVIVRYQISKLANFEGEVVRVLKRNTQILVGTLIKRKQRYFVKGMVGKTLIWASVKDIHFAKPNFIVKVAIKKYYAYDQVEGEIVQVCGEASDVGMDITMQVVASGIRYIFDEETLKEAKSLPQKVEKNLYPHRRDLTNELIFTIDGDDARDFDDAVGLTILENGNWLLKVCIADVSEYVKENSYLDLEAYERGTSVYLPDRVIPMLPVELSNGICSLNEHVDRLVMVAEMEITPKGKVVSSDHYEAIMKSVHRMTYSIVNQILEEEKDELIQQYEDIYSMLKHMQSLAQTLYEVRIKRGSFDFETSEAKLKLNSQGEVLDIELRERRTAEKLIEEFMLLANESVAEKMTWLDIPFLYRVHDEPDEERLNLFLNRLSALEQEFSYKNKASLPKALQQLLLDTNDENNPLEKTLKTVISNTLLRTMAKARYQEINIGHYGLASKCYTHFTSPIRRYPDLLVHRLMKQFLFHENQLFDTINKIDEETVLDYFTKKVHDTGMVSSLREKTAESLERNTVDMKKCEYMEKYIGTIFSGMISSIVGWGMYVTLDNTVEGLVRFDDMPNDYYEVDEKLGQIYGKRRQEVYQMGDLVKVKLIDINIERHQISFKLIGKIE